MDQLSELSIFNFEYHIAVALFSATCPTGFFLFWFFWSGGGVRGALNRGRSSEFTLLP